MSISAFSLSEDSLDGRHCVISIALSMENRVIHTHSLSDCGTSSYAFIDSSFARKQFAAFHPSCPSSYPRSSRWSPRGGRKTYSSDQVKDANKPSFRARLVLSYPTGSLSCRPGSQVDQIPVFSCISHANPNPNYEK